MESLQGIDGKEGLSPSEIKIIQELAKLTNNELLEKVGKENVQNFLQLLYIERTNLPNDQGGNIGNKTLINSIILQLGGDISDKVDKKVNTEDLEFKTSIGILKFSEIENYNPKTTPEKISAPKNTQNFLEEEYLDRRNIEATDMNKVSLWIKEFCDKNKIMLASLKIKDIRELSPKQAILLTSKIVQRNLEYANSQLAVEKNKDKYTIDESYISKLSKIKQEEIRKNPEVAYKKYTFSIDNAPINQLLKIDKQGVCRNYAQAVKVVFDSLKSLQKSENTQLNNTYSKQFGSSDKDIYEENAAERNIINNHRWNAFYTILPNGNLNEVIMDVTYTDDGGSESYSQNRMLFELINLVDNNLMTKEQQISQLKSYFASLDKNKSLTLYIAISEYLGDYYVKTGDTKKGISYYLKQPYISFSKLQRKATFKDKDMDRLVEALFSDENNRWDDSFYPLFSEYFYKKGEYKTAINYGLEALTIQNNDECLLVLIASCIKNGSEEWREHHYSLNIFLNHPEWFQKDYSEELKLITNTYGIVG